MDVFYCLQIVFIILAFIMTANYNIINISQLPFTMPTNEQFSFWSLQSCDSHVLKHAYCVYVRPLLEFSIQIWSPHYKYLIEKISRYWGSSLKDYLASIRDHTVTDWLLFNLETVKHHRLGYDLVFCYKMLHVLHVVPLHDKFA